MGPNIGFLPYHPLTRNSEVGLLGDPNVGYLA